MAQSYEKAGVNLEAGYEVVRRIKKHVASTSRLGVMGNIGAFGGDYGAVGHNEPQTIEAIVSGVADGCRQAGCALVGGETAEMPGMYSEC